MAWPIGVGRDEERTSRPEGAVVKGLHAANHQPSRRIPRTTGSPRIDQFGVASGEHRVDRNREAAALLEILQGRKQRRVGAGFVN